MLARMYLVFHLDLRELGPNILFANVVIFIPFLLFRSSNRSICDENKSYEQIIKIREQTRLR